MPTRVLIVPDKFKGTLTGQEAAEAIANGWLLGRPQDLLEILPMSDGGDGFGAITSRLLGAEPISCRTVDAAHRPCEITWGWDSKTKTAIIETAAVIGLAMLPSGKFHPFELDTFGLGAVFRAAEDRKARCCLVGIGGSSTNDGGLGLARALGWSFLDERGNEIERWIDLKDVSAIRRPPHKASVGQLDIRVAVDVQNKLLGPKGASRVYGPQKGLTPPEVARAEAALRKLARIAQRSGLANRSRQPGTGAAGGLGFSLATFLGAKLEPGFELFAQYADLNRRLERADLVITGEGSIDASSFMGKGVGQIAAKCRRLKIPCIGLGGRIDLGQARARVFSRLAAITAITTLQKAIAEPAFWLSRLAERIAKDPSLRTGLNSAAGRLRSAR